jgi:hypothetical protein
MWLSMSPVRGVNVGSCVSAMCPLEKLLDAPNVFENSESRLLFEAACGIGCCCCCSCLMTGAGPPKMSRSVSWFDLGGLVGPDWFSAIGEEKLRP